MQYGFLTKEWIYAATKAIEDAKKNNGEFTSLTRGFTLNIVYVVKDLPDELRKMYGSDEISVYIELIEGELKN